MSPEPLSATPSAGSHNERIAGTVIAMSDVSLILNVLWLALGGLWMAIGG